MTIASATQYTIAVQVRIGDEDFPVIGESGQHFGPWSIWSAVDSVVDRLHEQVAYRSEQILQDVAAKFGQSLADKHRVRSDVTDTADPNAKTYSEEEVAVLRAGDKRDYDRLSASVSKLLNQVLDKGSQVAELKRELEDLREDLDVVTDERDAALLKLDRIGGLIDG